MIEFTERELIYKNRIKQLIETFQHYHVNNGVDDKCKQCGLDLFDGVHIRGDISGPIDTGIGE